MDITNHTTTETNQEKPQSKAWEFLNNIKLDFLQQHIALILWVVFFLLLYIANGHRAIKTIRKINQLNAEVTKMKYEYLIYKSELTDLTKQGNLSLAMQKFQLKPLNQQPIILNDSLTNE